MELSFDEKFIRIWEFYLIYSAAGFKSRAVGDYQIRIYVCIHALSIYLPMLFPDKWKSYTPSDLKNMTGNQQGLQIQRPFIFSAINDEINKILNGDSVFLGGPKYVIFHISK